MVKININELGDRVIRSCDVDIDLRTPVKTEDDGLLYKTVDNKKLVRIISRSERDGFQKEIFEKLLEPKEIRGVVTPSNIMVVHNDIIGYTMDNITGVDDITYEEKLDSSVKNNLHRIAHKYQEL